MPFSYRYLAPKSSGDMAIAGRGIRVYTMYCAYEMGDSAELLAENYDLPLPAVLEALAYAYDHLEEMDSIRRGDEEAGRRLTAELPDHLRRMAEEIDATSDKETQELKRKAKEARLSTPLS